MKLMDIKGVEDIKEVDLDGIEGIEVYTKFTDLAHVRDEIEKLGYVIEEADIIKEPKVTKQLSGSDFVRAQEGLEKLDDHNDVQNVWSNLEEVN
jgi:transcriptional/translational regulatory protein YebC/TACO1